MTDIPSQKRRYWLLTSPRTASNMLVRMLNLDEQGVRPAFLGGYFFFTNVLSRVQLFLKPTQEWTPEDYANASEGAKGCFNALQDYIEASENAGQKVYVKEHIGFLNSIYTEAEFIGGAAFKRPDPNMVETGPMRGLTHATRSPLNMTCLPDEFLKTWHPTFLIRHPAMMLPSVYRTALTGVKAEGVGRATREPYEIEATLKFVRSLYDFYVNYFGKDSQWPLVLDADDVILHPEVMAKYAGLVELDADKFRFTWERISDEEQNTYNPADRLMRKFLNDSSGLDKSKAAGNIDISAEAAKWRTEFGEEAGRKLERWVRDAMPDYEYMLSRKLKA